MNRKFLSYTVGIALSSLAFGAVANASTVNLRILETSDIHMHLMNYDYEKSKVDNGVGFVKVASIIKSERKKNKNIFLVDDGDLIQGTAVADYIQAQYNKHNHKLSSHIAYKLLTSLHYDVASFGNHEFNYGLPFLLKAIKSANFPIVTANIYHVDKNGKPTTHYFKPSVILKRSFVDTKGKKHIIRIGVIGAVPPQIMSWDRTNLLGKVVTTDIIDSVTEQVNKIRSKSDVVLIVAHSGPGSNSYTKMKENAGYQLTKIKGVDAVAIGHAHVVFPSKVYADWKGIDVEKGTINGIPIIEPAAYGSHLGVINLKLNINSKGKVTVADGNAHVVPISKKEGRKVIPLVKSDPQTVKFVSQIHKNTIKYMDQPVGKITQNYSSYFAVAQNTPLIQLVNDAQIDYAKNVLQNTKNSKLPLLSASAPFKAGGFHNGLGSYTYVKAGNVSLKNISDIYMYPNTLRIVKITGANIVEWLEKSALFYAQINPNSTKEQDLLSYNAPTFNLDIMSNITYKIDLTKPARYDKAGKKISNEHRIIDVMYNGKPIDLKQNFAVATNNYRASGGGSFPGLEGTSVIYQTTDTLPDILKTYMIKHSPLTVKVQNNFTFKKNFPHAKVTFKTSVEGIHEIPKNLLTLFKDNKDGSIQVKLK